MNILTEIMDWNIDRDNLSYSCVREGSMIQEEVEELGLAFREGTEVDEADAYADIIFVAVGSLLKLCKGDKQKVLDILMVVTAANNLKTKDVDGNGKIVKPDGFASPEGMIEAILDGR